MDSKEKKRSRCAYRPCPAQSDIDTSFFAFPKDPERAKVWLKACNREDLLCMDSNKLNKNYRLCGKHFEEKFISKGGVRPRLFERATPTLFLHAIPDVSSVDESQPSQPKTACIKPSVEASTSFADVSSVDEGEPSHPKRASNKPSVEASTSFADVSSVDESEPSHPKRASIKPSVEASTSFADVSSVDESQPSQPKRACIEPSVEPSTSFAGHSNVHSSGLSIVCTVGSPPSSPLHSPTIGTQTPATLSSGTPRKQKLRGKIKALRRQRKPVCKEDKHEWTIDDFYAICDKFLSKPLAEIVKAQAALNDKPPTSRRYSNEYKQFALTLYFLGPRAYSFMSKLICLPTKRTLERLTQHLACKPGLVNDAIFSALEIKVQTMLELDKHCTICIDEMALKKNLFYHTGRDELVGLHDIGRGEKEFCYAQNALVIMARGLYSNWKQPIAYFFLKSQFQSSELKVALEECVLKLTKAGLYVDAIVSDMGSNFIELANSLGITPENPEFELSGVNLIYLFDICHLIKAIRNNLINNIFHFNDKKTSWTFIEHFFKLDSKQFYRCAPKLSHSHINPSNFEKMRVKLAVQVLSHTVAAGMNVYMSLGALPNDALGTIEFIEKFNNLFDMLNSSSTEENHKYKKVFEGDEFQINYLNEMIDFLKNLKVFNKNDKDVTLKSKCVNRFILTINGVKKIWEKLSAAGFKYLKTRRLNSDCLEIFFGGIRQQGGNCINPTPVQFERAFRKLFSQNFLHSNNMNCKNDLDELLVRLDSKHLIELQNESNPENPMQAISLPDYSYRNEDMAYQNAFKYVCGYLLKKSLGIHRCGVCIQFSKDCEELDTSQLLIYFRAYDTDKSIYGGLRTPNEQFVNFVYNLEKTFISNFDNICVTSGISHLFFNSFKNIRLNHPCPEFPLPYALKLFIRLRLFYTVKFANRDLKDNKKDKKNRKIVILSHL